MWESMQRLAHTHTLLYIQHRNTTRARFHNKYNIGRLFIPVHYSLLFHTQTTSGWTIILAVSSMSRWLLLLLAAATSAVAIAVVVDVVWWCCCFECIRRYCSPIHECFNSKEHCALKLFVCLSCSKRKSTEYIEKRAQHKHTNEWPKQSDRNKEILWYFFLLPPFGFCRSCTVCSGWRVSLAQLGFTDCW